MKIGMMRNRQGKVSIVAVFLAVLMVVLAVMLFYALGKQGGGGTTPPVTSDDYYDEGTITINVKDNRGLTALSNIDTIEFYPDGTSFKDCASGTATPQQTASAVSTSTTWYVDKTNGGPLPDGDELLMKTVWVEEGTEPVWTYYPGPYQISFPSIPKTASSRTATSSDILLDDVGTLAVGITIQVPGQSASTSAIVLDANAGNEYVDLTINLQASEADSVLKHGRLYIFENSSAAQSSDVCDPGAYSYLKSMSVSSKAGGVSDLKSELHGTDGGLSTSYDVYYVDLPDMQYDNAIPDQCFVKFRLVMDASTTSNPGSTLGVLTVWAGFDATTYDWTEYNDDGRDYYKTTNILTID